MSDEYLHTETPTPEEAKSLHPCKVCGTVDSAKPQIFRGEDWCCDLHRKMVKGELPMNRHTVDPTETGAPPGKGGVSDTRSY